MSIVLCAFPLWIECSLSFNSLHFDGNNSHIITLRCVAGKIPHLLHDMRNHLAGLSGASALPDGCQQARFFEHFVVAIESLCYAVGV